jgi:hypothetical protein
MRYFDDSNYFLSKGADMKISDVFQLRRGGKFWGLELRKPLQTLDSRKSYQTQGSLGTGRARDVLLTPPSQAELAENARRIASTAGLDLGKTWVGDLTEKLDAITDRKQLGDALSAMVSGLSEYGTARARGEGKELDGTGTLAFQGDERADDPLGHGKPNENDPATKRTGDAMRRWRNQDFARIEGTQEANRRFWHPDKPAA